MNTENNKIIMEYPYEENNRLWDGNYHEIEPRNLYKIENSEYYFMEYWDCSVKNNCITILQKYENMWFKVPLSDYNGLTEYLSTIKMDVVPLEGVNEIHCVSYIEKLKYIKDFIEFEKNKEEEKNQINKEFYERQKKNGQLITLDFPNSNGNNELWNGEYREIAPISCYKLRDEDCYLLEYIDPKTFKTYKTFIGEKIIWSKYSILEELEYYKSEFKDESSKIERMKFLKSNSKKFVHLPLVDKRLSECYGEEIIRPETDEERINLFLSDFTLDQVETSFLKKENIGGLILTEENKIFETSSLKIKIKEITKENNRKINCQKNELLEKVENKNKIYPSKKELRLKIRKIHNKLTAEKRKQIIMAILSGIFACGIGTATRISGINIEDLIKTEVAALNSFNSLKEYLSMITPAMWLTIAGTILSYKEYLKSIKNEKNAKQELRDYEEVFSTEEEINQQLEILEESYNQGKSR